MQQWNTPARKESQEQEVRGYETLQTNLIVYKLPDYSYIVDSLLLSLWVLKEAFLVEKSKGIYSASCMLEFFKVVKQPQGKRNTQKPFLPKERGHWQQTNCFCGLPSRLEDGLQSAARERMAMQEVGTASGCCLRVLFTFGKGRNTSRYKQLRCMCSILFIKTGHVTPGKVCRHPAIAQNVRMNSCW